jgi:hypothetical protein
MQAPCADTPAGGADALPQWCDLPGDVLGVIGSMMCCPAQLSSATRVCKTWNSGIAAGVERLELDMNRDHAAFAAKVEQLQRRTPALVACKAHVSTSVPTTQLAENLHELGAKLKNIQVRARVGGRVLQPQTAHHTTPHHATPHGGATQQHPLNCTRAHTHTHTHTTVAAAPGP